MDNQPPVDRSILLPILIGAFSIFGILIIVLLGRTSASRATVVEEPTETPFDYIFLGTEPGPTGTVSPEVTESTLFTMTPFDSEIGTPTPLPPAVTPDLGIPNVTPTTSTARALTSLPTSTSASGPPLGAGTYDDVDSHLIYDGWVDQEVDSAYGGTLHVSNLPGSTVTFRFIGTELRIGYQVASSLGTVIVRIDNTNFDPVDQSDVNAAINEWISPNPLSLSSHTVTITHASGGSVNLDYVIIPAVTPTGTPTTTPTVTPAP